MTLIINELNISLTSVTVALWEMGVPKEMFWGLFLPFLQACGLITT